MTKHADLAGATADIARRLLAGGRGVPPIKDPFSIGSAFGSGRPGTVELLGHVFTLTDPLSVVLERPERAINIPYLVGNLLWTVSGSNRVADIVYYNSRAPIFSEDGEQVVGAWGPRLFGKPGTLEAQFDAAVRLIQEDPATRRAVLVLLTPDEVVSRSRDVSCAATLQLLLRNDTLHAVTTMRSQSTIGVLPYDVFLFASLQCIAAAELGVGPGDYIHVSGSLHAYEDELELLTLAANDAFSCRRLSSLPALATMTELTILESQLRMAVESRRSREVERIWDNVSYEPGSFAYEVTALLAATALDRVGLPEHAAEVMKHSGPFASS